MRYRNASGERIRVDGARILTCDCCNTTPTCDPTCTCCHVGTQPASYTLTLSGFVDISLTETNSCYLDSSFNVLTNPHLLEFSSFNGTYTLNYAAPTALLPCRWQTSGLPNFVCPDQGVESVTVRFECSSGTVVMSIIVGFEDCVDASSVSCSVDTSDLITVGTNCVDCGNTFMGTMEYGWDGLLDSDLRTGNFLLVPN